MELHVRIRFNWKHILFSLNFDIKQHANGVTGNFISVKFTSKIATFKKKTYSLLTRTSRFAISGIHHGSTELIDKPKS